jgi:hypothetical protein
MHTVANRSHFFSSPVRPSEMKPFFAPHQDRSITDEGRAEKSPLLVTVSVSDERFFSSPLHNGSDMRGVVTGTWTETEILQFHARFLTTH